LKADPAKLPTFDFQPAAAIIAPPPFAPRPDELQAVTEMLRRETGGQSPLVLLNANASDLLPLRRWPSERYVDLAKRLVEKFPGLHVGFTGAPDEAEATGRLVARVGSPRAVLLAGKTTLRQLLTLYTLADVLVTNDSGPAHFATLAPIHVVTLFGPETPTLFAARTPRNRVLWSGIACSPCVNPYNNRQSPCRDNLCMQSITVDQVFAEVCRALEERRRTS
jgi:ADP-heptose:LPS heptosyltransferase